MPKRKLAKLACVTKPAPKFLPFIERKTMRKHQSGFTLIELIIVISVVLGLSMLGGLIYVAIHFLNKFW